VAVRALLDASALVAFVRNERGAEVIERLIRSRVAATTPLGLAETLITVERKGYARTRNDLHDDLLELGLMIEPVVENDALEIAFLLGRSDAVQVRHGSARLSLGDATCLAVAARLDVPAVMSDGAWEVLDVPGLKVRPFR